MAFQVKPEAALASCFRNILQDMQPIFNSNDLLSFWGIDLKTLEKRLKRIQDLLNDAEWRSQTEGSVSDWMDYLRELLYCIEDFVDDMNIERVRMEKQLAAKNQAAYTAQKQLAALNEAIRSPEYASQKQLEAQNYHSLDHQAASKYTFGDIMADYTSQKDTILKSIKKIFVKLEEVAKDAKELNLKPQTLAGTPVTSFAVKDGEDIGPLVDESEIYGRQEDKDHVIKLLMNHNDSSRNYSVVSIVGMGGVGKTILARLVFKDKKVKNHFQKQSWACSSDDFDFSRVVRELIEYISKEKTSEMTTAALLDRLNGMIADQKVLFVLDDMWMMEAWEKLKGAFTNCAKGSKILVTTRNKNIGHSISNKEIYELQTLEDKYCRVLFKEKAFGGVVDERLGRIGTKIVERCKGVPLAVKVIGSSLRFAPEEIWEKTLKNKIWQSMDVAKDGIFPVLKLSYNYLPSSLKRCFQYFSVFPTDYSFERENLVRLWIAEGLIESREGAMLEELGCSYYSELQRRCLVQEDDRMHDLLHSLACLVSGKLFSRSAKGRKSHKPLGSILHVSLIEEGKVEMFDESKCFRTLLVSANCLFDETCLKSTSWRVLDGRSNVLRELPSSVGNLKHLRYLNLSGCSNLQSLPDSICELHNLQTLDLSACRGMRGSALPTEMGNLQNLRYLCLFQMEYLSDLPSSIVKLSNLLTLNLNGCRKLTCMPDNIGGLQSLQTLCLKGCRSILQLPSDIGNLQHLRELRLGGCSISCLPESFCNIRNLRVLDIFVVGREGHGIELLKDMTQLQGELTISHLENVDSIEHAQKANLKKKVLDEIHFEWSNAFLNKNVLVDIDLEARVLDELEPQPMSLRSLYILNYRGGRIPKWISALSFPILKKLVMVGLEGMNRMVGLELPSLKRLEIESCLKLKDVSMGVPNLINLWVFACRDLTTLSISPSVGNSSSSLTSSILDLPQLKELAFGGCSSLRDIHMMNVSGLEELQIEDCKELKMRCADHMPNLRKLMLKSLPNLTLLGGLHPGPVEGGGMFPILRDLDVQECPKLKFSPEGLEELKIEDCKELKMIYADHMPNLRELMLRSLPNLTLLGGLHPGPVEGGGMFPNLQDLDVQECPKLKFSPEWLRHITSLEFITFSGDPLEALKVASLQNLPRLWAMKITGFAGQVLVGDDEAGSTPSSLPPTLTRLGIQNCPNLTHLPKALLTIASLRRLTISDCPELVSLPETGLPPLLQELEVSSCKNLQYLPTGLGDHTSLRDVFIGNCDLVQARPDDPPNFTFLRVVKCPKLEQQIEQIKQHTQQIEQYGDVMLAKTLDALRRGIQDVDDPKVTGVRPDDPPNFTFPRFVECPKLEQQIEQCGDVMLAKTLDALRHGFQDVDDPNVTGVRDIPRPGIGKETGSGRVRNKLISKLKELVHF